MKPKAAARPLGHTHPPRLALREAPRHEVCLAGHLFITCLLRFVPAPAPSLGLGLLRLGRLEEQSDLGGTGLNPCTCPRRKVLSRQVVQGWPRALGSPWRRPWWLALGQVAYLCPKQLWPGGWPLSLGQLVTGRGMSSHRAVAAQCVWGKDTVPPHPQSSPEHGSKAQVATMVAGGKPLGHQLLGEARPSTVSSPCCWGCIRCRGPGGDAELAGPGRPRRERGALCR